MPARVVDLREAGALDYLVDYYAERSPLVLKEVLAQAYAAGAQTAVVEHRYIDADYRDEHSRFYSTTFRRYPAVAHRVHFFRDPSTEQLVDPVNPIRFAELGYLGYMVMRPVPGAPVGRVHIAAPPGLDGLTCSTREKVNLFGEYLDVQGTPFLAQDAQLMRCAHTALWVVARYHHLNWGTRRRLPSDIVDAVPIEIGTGRALPSPGLTVAQMSAAATRLELPPLVYDLDQLPKDETLLRIACRYLNSGMPVIAAGGGHAFVLTGYRRVREGQPDARIEFIRQDDLAGPYQVVPDYVFDNHAPWKFLIVPLPPKLYVAGEEAEALGRAWLELILKAEGIDFGNDRTVRTTAVPSNDYKAGLEGRGIPARQAAVLRRAPMSRWIWVVEVVDRKLRATRNPAVIAEMVIDATDHARDRRPIAWRTPQTVSVQTPDTRQLLSSRTEAPTAPVSYTRGSI